MSLTQKTKCSRCLKLSCQYGTSSVPECMLESLLSLPDVLLQEQFTALNNSIYSAQGRCDYWLTESFEISKRLIPLFPLPELSELLSRLPTVSGRQSSVLKKLIQRKSRDISSAKQEKNI